MKANINNNIFELPMGELYKDKFLNYTDGDIIDLDIIDDINEKYKKVDELFGFVCRSFVVMFMEEDEALEIKRKISSVDNRQRFFYNRGEIQKSMQIMNDFMVEMCTFLNQLKEEESSMKM